MFAPGRQRTPSTIFASIRQRLCRLAHVLRAFVMFAITVTKLTCRITTMRGACLQA
ncbi:hypothetical protein XAPC_3042 [Xanthomonas citri pv. punicae str. LMG 859]|nr:hypothetical protein XAPC_3042 [Xanthomonas citri pv. punicae str. LMG 859]